jgi:putative addiction module component (TIGR02574 family)
MRIKVKSLAQSVVLLPPKDRAYLIEHLLASLDEADLERQWSVEAKRRRDEIRSGQVKPMASDEVYRRIDCLLGK